MSATKLTEALRNLAEEINALGAKAIDDRDGALFKKLDHAALGLEVLAHIVDGKTLEKAFGAPGDWGYGTPIVDGLLALLRGPRAPQTHKLDTAAQVFFYEQDFYIFSNFSAFNLVWKEHRFHTSEAAYQWEKFTHLADRLICNKIATAPSAHEAFKMAELCRNVRRPDWDEVKVGIMREILRAKVQQHEYVGRKLLATGTRELIEDSWRDDFWGWGPNRDGQNMLGKLWMEVRAEMKGGAE